MLGLECSERMSFTVQSFDSLLEKLFHDGTVNRPPFGGGSEDGGFQYGPKPALKFQPNGIVFARTAEAKQLFGGKVGQLHDVQSCDICIMVAQTEHTYMESA